MNYSMFKTPNSRGFRKSCGSASSTVKSPLQSASSEQDCSSQGGKPPVATVIAAVVEGRGAAKGEVGFGLLDLEPVQLQISQFSDTLTYNRLRIKMQVYRPLVVLMPDSACQRGGDMSMLVELLRDEFAGVAIVPLMRKHFNSDEGLDKINLLRLEESSHLDKDLTNKYYGLACASAVLKYAEMVQNVVLMPHSIKVTCIGAETTCLIDPATSVHLELMMAINKSGKALMGKSLFDVLNRTSTKGGARLLRSNILQPSTDLALIQMRLEAIEALLSNEEAFYTLRSLVGRLVDVDKIIGLCVGVCRSETAKAAEYKITQS